MLELQVDPNMMLDCDNVDEAVTKVLGWLAFPMERKEDIVQKTQQHIMTEFTGNNKRDRIYGAIMRSIRDGEDENNIK